MIRRFWLHESHATELAHRSLEQSGWTLTAGADWQLAWSLDLPGAATFADAAGGRWVNHLRGIAALTVKSHLCHTLRAGAQRAATAGAGALFAFAPQTFVLPGEWDEWMRARAWDPDAVWIQKPADSSRGRGVALVTNPDEVRGNHLVVQRYIANPHLLDGYKYSLRCYVLIVSLEPLIAYLFDDGFTKLASRPFSLAAEDRRDRFRHLTNPDVLRDDPEAEGVSSRNTTHRQYRQRLRESGIDDAALFTRIRRAIAATLVAAQPRMRAIEHEAGGNGRGQFELLGVDIAIDDTLQPWLLECNLAPSLSVEASAATQASRDEAAIKTQVVFDTLRMVGANDTPEPPLPPATEAEARARLSWHDARRGGFERLWPGADALATLPGVEHLGAMDRALLADAAAGGGWPKVAANAVETMALEREGLLFERAHHRITLLTPDEHDSWQQLITDTPAANLPAATWATGIEWLREGLLLPNELADPDRATEVVTPMAPRKRLRWNQERVYAIHGMQVAVVAPNARLAAAIDQGLAWWDASDTDLVDATIHVPPRAAATDVIAHMDRLALRHLGGVVRRAVALATKGRECVLVIGGHREAARLFGDDWTLDSRPTIFGGTPFGAWTDRGGHLQPVAITAIAGTAASRGNLLLDLVSAGPGVVCAFDGASVRALAQWFATIPIRATANPRS